MTFESFGINKVYKNYDFILENKNFPIKILLEKGDIFFNLGDIQNILVEDIIFRDTSHWEYKSYEDVTPLFIDFYKKDSLISFLANIINDVKDEIILKEKQIKEEEKIIRNEKKIISNLKRKYGSVTRANTLSKRVKPYEQISNSCNSINSIDSNEGVICVLSNLEDEKKNIFQFIFASNLYEIDSKIKKSNRTRKNKIEIYKRYSCIYPDITISLVHKLLERYKYSGTNVTNFNYKIPLFELHNVMDYIINTMNITTKTMLNDLKNPSTCSPLTKPKNIPEDFNNVIPNIKFENNYYEDELISKFNILPLR